MKIFLCAFIGLSIPSLFAADSKPLTIERIFDSPELDGEKLIQLKFSPNGKRLSFLRPKKTNYEILDLWEADMKTGESRLLVDSGKLQFGELSEVEKARRERMRITRSGIVEYFWSELGDKIVFPAGGDLHLYDFRNPLKRLTKNEAAEVDVAFSSNDGFISFTRDQNLYIYDLKADKEFAVTTTGKDTLSFGSAEFIAQEEMHRFEGHWWSKDEKQMAFVEVDESPVKVVDRYEIGATGVTIRKQRYPEAGTANAKVRLGVIAIEDVVAGRLSPRWVDLGKNTDIYLPRVKWTHDGKLIYQVQSRDQKTLDIFSFDPVTSSSTKILRETNSHWVDLSDDWHFMKSNTNWIWASEKSGYKHLYLMSRQGKVIRELTKGNWAVSSLERVDEKKGWVYFVAGIDTPIERRLYRVSIEAPQAPESLTKDATWNSVVMDKEGDYFINYSSTPSTPGQVSLHKVTGEKTATLLDNTVNEKHPLYPYAKNLIEPEYSSFKGPSGEEIYYSLYKPANFDPNKKYPLVVTGYGGPGAQMVTKSWSSRSLLIANVLLKEGFLVATFDNRGSRGRGRKFSDALYHAFGTVEVEDQKAGVLHLAKQGFIDRERVGFFGWSYGGYLSLMLASKAADIFKANVSVAPVTDFSLYDTHYTERFMGKPNENKKAYKVANVLEFVPQIKGRVLVIHGMADDNVLFTNSTILFKHLQEAGIVYESITYPGAKHGISGKANQTHVFKSLVDFFKRHLQK